MKTRMNKMGILLTIFLLISLLVATSLNAEDQKESKRIEIIFNHDLHAHIDPFITKSGETEEEVGGFSRIKSFIDQKCQAASNTLVVDAGDFTMGTLYQTIGVENASELRLLGAMGVEATTLGNHEFDYGMEELTKMFQNAIDSGDKLPEMLICNIDWEKSLQGENATVNERFKEVLDAYGAKKYMIVEKAGMRIALTGVFGEDSLLYSPKCTLSFINPIEAVKETVQDIKKNELVDMIICLSHSGTNKDIKKSEDEQLAMKVPELDLIISGHSHTRLEEPIIYGDTAIVACEYYGKYCGDITLEQKGSRWQVADYQLVKMDAHIPKDQMLEERISTFSAKMDERLLRDYGYTKDQVLCYNPWKYPDIDLMYKKVQEQPFANLLADAYLYKMQELGMKKNSEPMISVVPMGAIRDSFAKDKVVTVSNVYDAFPLGMGDDGTAGYPLIKIYLTGKELKSVCEVDASISSVMSTAQLFMGGLSYKSNTKRFLLNRVTDVSLVDVNGQSIPVEDEKLYPLVTDLYSGNMLGAVKKMSYNLISIVPKDEAGRPIEDINDAVILYNGKEMKAWVTMADYLASFSQKGEVGNIPEYYSILQDRKNITSDGSIGTVLRSPNEMILKVGGILLAVIIVIILIVIGIIKLIKRLLSRKNKKLYVYRNSQKSKWKIR